MTPLLASTSPSSPLTAEVMLFDRSSAESAAAAFLSALGVRLDTSATAGTAARMAAAYAEMLTPQEFQPTIFPNESNYRGLLLERSIPFTSVCAHHMLPFLGTAHVGYLPGTQLLGLSKLARLVVAQAARPQIQEQLTEQLADRLADLVDARGVGVVITAEHLCMTIRGVHARGTTTVTSSWRGDLADPQAQAAFFTQAEAQR